MINISEWMKQFNYLMNERGELEDFTLLQPSRPLEEIRKEISRARTKARRDVLYESWNVASIEPPWPEILGGVSIMDDLSNVIPITKNKQLEKLTPGDTVTIDIEGHYYNKSLGTIVEIDRKKYIIELIDKLPKYPRNKNSTKVILKLNRQDLKKKQKEVSNEKDSSNC